jgi:hypothetical protein
MPQYRWNCPECGECGAILTVQQRRLLKAHGNACANCGEASSWQSVYEFGTAGILFGNAQKAADSETVLYSERERREFLRNNPNIVELKGDQARMTGQALRDKKDQRAWEKGYQHGEEASQRRKAITDAVRRGATPPKKPDPRDIEDAMVAQGKAFRFGNTVYRVPYGGNAPPTETTESRKTFARQEAEQELNHKVEAAARKFGIAR